MNCKYCGKVLPKSNQWGDKCSNCAKKFKLVVDLVGIGKKIKAGTRK
jgi:hypothetical protein